MKKRADSTNRKNAGPPEFKRYALVALTNTCNQKCAFCFEASTRYEIPEKSRLCELIDDIADRGFERIVFIGGEAVLNNDLPGLITRIIARKMEARITTNGTALSDERRLKQLLDAGLRHFEFSMHTHREKDSAILCGRRGTLKKQIAALDNIKKLSRRYDPPVTINTNTVLTTLNAPYLHELFDFFSSYPFITAHSLKVPTFEGRLLDNLHLAPKYSGIIGVVTEAHGRLSGTGVDLILDNFPLCTLPADLLPSTVSFMDSGAVLEGFNYENRLDSRRFDMYTDLKCSGKCARCALAAICGGFSSKYFELYSDSEVRPVSSLSEFPARINDALIDCLSRRHEKDVYRVSFPPSSKSYGDDGILKMASDHITSALRNGYGRILYDLSRCDFRAQDILFIFNKTFQGRLFPTLLCSPHCFNDSAAVEAYTSFKSSVETRAVFYSSDSRIHNILSGGIPFESCCYGIMNLVRIGMPPHLAIPVSGINSKGLSRLVKFGAELGVIGFTMEYVQPSRGKKTSHRDEVFEDVRAAVALASRRYPYMRIELSSFPFDQFPGLHHLFKPPYDSITRHRKA